MMPEMELRRLAAVFVAALVAGSCQAQEVGWAGRDINHSKTELIVSPYTYHFSGTKGHSYVVLAGAAAVQPSGYLYGGALFNNSFGQPSAYVFVGQEFVEPWNLRNFYYTMTVGLIYGYKGAHKDEIKPNVAGFSPGVVPRLGYRLTPHLAVEAATLGFAAVMFNLNITLP